MSWILKSCGNFFFIVLRYSGWAFSCYEALSAKEKTRAFLLALINLNDSLNGFQTRLCMILFTRKLHCCNLIHNNIIFTSPWNCKIMEFFINWCSCNGSLSHSAYRKPTHINKNNSQSASQMATPTRGPASSLYTNSNSFQDTTDYIGPSSESLRQSCSRSAISIGYLVGTAVKMSPTTQNKLQTKFNAF